MRISLTSLLMLALLSWTAGLADARIGRGGGGGRPTVQAGPQGGQARAQAAARQPGAAQGGQAAMQQRAAGAGQGDQAAMQQRAAGAQQGAQQRAAGAQQGVQQRQATAAQGSELSRTGEIQTDTNINRNVSGNVNVNRDVDVDVHEGWGWGWGSFATGAAVGATTGAIAGAAAAHHEPDVVVVSPPVGTYVSSLPPGCTAVSTGTSVVYNCAGAYYKPYYDGPNLVYQAVPSP